MKFVLCFGLALLALLAVVSTPASADIIAEAISGPGGTGHEGLALGFGATLIEPVLDFTSLDYIDVTVTVDGATTFDVNEAASFGSVKNNTRQTWSGFALENENTDLGSFSLDWYEADPSPDFDLVGSSATDVGLSTYLGGPGVPDGAIFTLSGHYSTTDAGTITIREFPTAVPEPGSILLSAAGLSLIRRRHTSLRN